MERKLVTIVFADLVGSTALADEQDPERTRALLDRFYDEWRPRSEPPAAPQSQAFRGWPLPESRHTCREGILPTDCYKTNRGAAGFARRDHCAAESSAIPDPDEIVMASAQPKPDFVGLKA
jgi:hypothetical protein